MDFWDKIISRALEKLWELFGETSTFLPNASINHLSLSLSRLHALVLHQYSFNDHN